MRQLILFLVFIFATAFFQACTFKVLRADKFLDKNEMGKAKNLIDKSVEKDAENPANQFMLAKYYSHPVWSYDAVDSAHLYIQLVQDTLPKLDLKTTKILAKKGLDSMAILKQALIIDSLAFEKALSINKEEAYNQYLSDYEFLTYEERAIALRNEVAYADALKVNTPSALQEFFRKYPDATQAKKAKDVFETLYFEQQTRDQSIQSYKDYLEERPQIVYAEDAAFSLLNIISAGASLTDYENFIAAYDDFIAAQQAKTIIEFLDFEQQQSDWLVHAQQDLFHFFDLNKNEKPALTLKNLVSDSCNVITSPYLLEKTDAGFKAYLRNGSPITVDEIEEISYLGSGFFKVKTIAATNYHLIHASLDEFFQQTATDFKALDDFHFAKKMSDGWHLISILNEPILKQAVDSIWKEADVFFFKKGDNMAVAATDDFKKMAKDDLKTLSFLYDDYEWLDTKYLRLFSKDYETVLDNKAKVIFALEKSSYHFFDNFWIKETGDEFKVLDVNRKTLFNDAFEAYQYKSGVLALQKDGLWSVFTDGLKGFPKFEYDTIRIFNSWLTYAENDSANYLLFQSGRKVQLSEKEAFRILKNYNLAFSDVSEQIRFVEISNDKGYFKLYNGFGRKVKEGEKLDINILTPKFVQIHQNRKKQLLDSAGIEMEIKDVEAFGAFQNGLIPILKNKKFGALQVDSLKIIPAHSQSKLEVFLKDSLYAFKEDNLWGISDASASVLLAADFESIEYFNDSTAIVEEEGEIGILNIYQNEYLHENVDSWERVEVGESQYFIVRKQAGYGLINQLGEEIIPFIFNELTAYESKGKLYWLAERRLSEINYIVIAYFDQDGKVLFKEGLNFDDYLKTACD